MRQDRPHKLPETPGQNHPQKKTIHRPFQGVS
jgi:hypothetical protein